MKTEPNHPANVITEETTIGQMGLTKREQFAAMAMQGMLSGMVDAHGHGSIDNEVVAKYSVNLADALIKALNNEQ